MKKRVVLLPRMSMRELDRRANRILHEIQKTLLPDHAAEIVAINVETGEHVVAATKDEAYAAFHERWPNQLSFVVRVDGGPATKFHGK